MKYKLLEIVSAIINVPCDELNEDSGPANLQVWDSLAHVTIVAAIESAFSITMSMSEIVSAKTIKDLISIVEKKL